MEGADMILDILSDQMRNKETENQLKK